MAQKVQPRFPLNVYKLRGEVVDPLSVVDVSGFPHVAEIAIGDGITAKLYYGLSLGTPKWFQVLSSIAKQSLEDMQASSVSAALVAQVGQHHFVLTFGHAWQRVKYNGIESNFGIRCVLNLAEPDSLRAIRRDRVAEATLQAIEQIPDSDEIDRFGMDLEKDLLRGVKAKVDESLGFGAWVAGGDAFKASVDLSSESIAGYLLRCFSLWGLDGYKKNFEWVDNILPIRDDILENRLKIELIRSIENNDRGLILCIPDLLTWDDHDFFSFERKKPKHAPCANHLDLRQWVEFAKAEKGEISSEILSDSYIYAYRMDGALSEKWPVFQCIHGLVLLDDRSYLAHGGHWFELNKDFVDRVNKKIADIPESNISLPSTTIREREGDYNERVAKESEEKILLMDKKLIHHGGGRSKFEVCDLFTEDGHLICVKPWGGESGNLSHLFLQARNSIELINNDLEYRDKVSRYIEHVAPKFLLSWNYICEEPKDAEVVLAILRGCTKDSLPFFAKLSMVSCVEDLRKMRFKATYIVINAV